MDVTQTAYCLRRLGSTERYIVYDLVIYPSIADDKTAQRHYQHDVAAEAAAAKAQGQTLWIAIDLSRLQAEHMFDVFYKIVLPCSRERITSKTYGAPHDPETRAGLAFGSLYRSLHAAFHYADVPHQAAALPPDWNQLGQELAGTEGRRSVPVILPRS